MERSILRLEGRQEDVESPGSPRGVPPRHPRTIDRRRWVLRRRAVSWSARPARPSLLAPSRPTNPQRSSAPERTRIPRRLKLDVGSPTCAMQVHDRADSPIREGGREGCRASHLGPRPSRGWRTACQVPHGRVAPPFSSMENFMPCDAAAIARTKSIGSDRPGARVPRGAGVR